MKLLLVNTCGLEGIVALADDSGVVAVERLPGRGTSEHLMPAVRRLFDRMAWTVKELSAVAVVNGPGSFTGVRVGLSAAKGLCEAGAVPMIALSRLALVAASGEDETVALLDAGRGEYYCAVGRAGEARNGIRIVEHLAGADEVQRLLERLPGITCEERVALKPGPALRLVPEPGPEEMLAMALRRIAAEDRSDVASVDASYLRRTDAELLMESR